ncbi:MAG TPA: hypothetical protein DDW24_05105 [Blastocatellia bacterium]|nr:hypothetical protein [Blastocatellia bacterium]
MMKRRSQITASLALIATIAISMHSTISVFGQTRRAPAGAVAANKPSQASKCSGAWTGTVKYTRTQGMTNNKTVDRVSGRGKDTTDFEMKYDYKAQVTVLEDPSRNGSSIGRATVDHKFTSNETVKAVEKNSCDRGKTWRDMTGVSETKTETSGTGSVDANVSVGVNQDGTYTVSVALPPIQGQTTGSQTSSYSGQCSPKEGKSFTMPATPTSIEGNSLTSDGTNRVDPSDPNRLSGSYSRTWQNVTETITWSLQKCGAPVRLTDLKFADMVFPNWNEWRELNEQTGTIDGNLVKVTAKVLNASGETKYADVNFLETYKGDKWDGAKADTPIKDSSVSIRLEAGEERDVEILWDTSGYAWYDDGRPRLVQRVKAELTVNGKKTDEMTKNVKVAPKPLVLIHGLWSNWKAWETWQNILTTSHSYDWKAFPVGEKPAHGEMNTGGSFMSTQPTNTIAQNAEQVKSYIEYAQRDRNAWHVDIVAHSMGGLIARDYINRLMPMNGRDGRPQVSRLVMLGTPNMGSPCADVMNTAFEVLGKKVEAVRQLRQDVVAEFNRTTVNRKGVKFSVLAGDPLPTMCKTLVWNDGVVPVPSAIWQIADNAKSKSLHTDLTGTSDFSSFVKPRLAIGPKGNHNPEVPQIPGSGTTSAALLDSGSDELLLTRTRGVRGLPDDGTMTPFAKAAVVGGRQTVVIELPVSDSTNFGVTFVAPQEVAVRLVDADGTIAGESLATSSEARGLFRSIFVNKRVKGGTWKLVVENTGSRELEIVLTTWANIG